MSAAASDRNRSIIRRRRRCCGRRASSDGRCAGARCAANRSWSTPTRATRSPACAWALRPMAASSPCRPTSSAISAPISRPSRPPCRRHSAVRCFRNAMRSPPSMPARAASTPIRRRPTPIAAPASRKRASSSSGRSMPAPARSGSIPVRSANAT